MHVIIGVTIYYILWKLRSKILFDIGIKCEAIALRFYLKKNYISKLLAVIFPELLQMSFTLPYPFKICGILNILLNFNTELLDGTQNILIKFGFYKVQEENNLSFKFWC